MTTDDRILIWAAGRDAALTAEVLADAGFACRPCAAAEEVAVQAEAGAGAVILAAERLTPDVVAYLAAAVDRQPPWSDLPVVVVAGAGTADPGPFEPLGNVAVLARPVPLDALVSTVRTALRARRRQYQMRELMRQRDDADRRKDEFLAMLAHELRNPLAPIRTAADLMRAKALTDPALVRVRDIITRQVLHLGRLVDDLLDVARVTRGKITLRKQPLDLAEAVRHAADGAGPAAAAGGVALAVAPLAGPVMVDADPTRVEQMVGNALSNAVKFTPAGGRVAVAVRRDGADAVVTVTDTGVGVPADMQDRVFDLFAQTARPLDRGQGGLGIGLTVLRSLARLHGGSATLTSPGPGLGAEVVIRLPALAAPPGGPAPAPAPAPPRPGVRVLVVDDNTDAADTTAMLLTVLGHDVEVVYDGPAALTAARRRPPQVAVCDIGLPGMDGYELVRRLRADLGLTGCVCIAVTGYGEDRDRDRAAGAGFDHHLTKPVDPAALAGLVAAPV